MDTRVMLIIFGMGLVTYIPRMLPIVVLSKFKLPKFFLSWLKYIPVAILSALLFPGVLLYQGKVCLTFVNKGFWAAVVCTLVSFKTKNLFITVLVGLVFMFILKRF